MNLAWKWTPENERKAMARLGVRRYRPGQRTIIEAVRQGKDVVGVLPTGGGKSLCYQLPAFFLPHAVLVVSPLISLMQDQQEKLEDRDIAAAKLNSTLTRSEERDTMDDIREGEPELIYVTPERLEQREYLDLLQHTGVSLFVVDEAHCVSQWGHDFRPAYLALRDAARALGRPPILALTATATPAVIDDVVTQLGVAQPAIVNLGIERPNHLLRSHPYGQRRGEVPDATRFVAERAGHGDRLCRDHSIGERSVATVDTGGHQGGPLSRQAARS